MAKYGWYYEGGCVQGEADTFDLIMEEIVGEADLDRLGGVMVGPMRDAKDLIRLDESDLMDALCDFPSTSEATKFAIMLLEALGERVGEAIEDGSVDAEVSKEAAEELGAIMCDHVKITAGPGLSEALQAWAQKHAQPDPEGYCEGEKALPRELVGGVWRSESSAPADAVITYETDPSDRGFMGWVWWAKGEGNSAPTYREARIAAEAAIAAG